MKRAAIVVALGLLLLAACAGGDVRDDRTSDPALGGGDSAGLKPNALRTVAQVPELSPLPTLERQPTEVVELGRLLFFENRLSGDASSNCATCHDPAKGWSDGLALAEGYPGTKYFRRTRSVLNSGHKRSLYWDGRLSGSDLQTLVRDHIAEAHFFQADGRLVLERLRQVPFYEQTFRDVMGGEPSYGRVLKAVAAFVSSLNSRNVPFDRYLAGEATALSEAARRGHELFEGKAGCIGCHNGPMLSDGAFHDLGVPNNDAIFEEPLRHITFRRFFKTLGVSDFAGLTADPGRGALTHQKADIGKFKTPTLREVSRTAPYMHGGVFASLEEVVAFYDRGGGNSPNKSPLLGSLGLTDGEKSELVAFLESLSGDPIEVERPEPFDYEPRALGEN